ncbi:hypothetical protein ARMSODRAFT_1027370 [Armillaria solidipes]|uniref:Uncharacterized protein n=1 Tax=Armillaria solidipes TaxID=1076256 RepID=A0A2H3APD0_9AGAR|nr:hypothetical protein ARMSODRAFT_1027370 [Armillaria solidipes]
MNVNEEANIPESTPTTPPVSGATGDTADTGGSAAPVASEMPEADGAAGNVEDDPTSQPGDDGPCAYTEEQVAWLRHLAPAFQQALWENRTGSFMVGLYRSWFHEWPEEPDRVLRRQNSLRRAMLAVSAELTPNLVMPADLNFRFKNMPRRG